MKNENNSAVENEDLEAEQLQSGLDAQAEMQQTQNEAIRDEQAIEMAKELAGETEEDFDPAAAFVGMTPEQEREAIRGGQELLASREGAEFAAIEAINVYEEAVQDYGHADFVIPDKKKENGVKRLSPVIQKYAPQLLGLLGEWKHEILAGTWTGSLAFTSVKQVKALRAEDARAAKAAKGDVEEQAPEPIKEAA